MQNCLIGAQSTNIVGNVHGKNEATSMKKKDWGKIMTQASFMVKSSSYKGIWVF